MTEKTETVSPTAKPAATMTMPDDISDVRVSDIPVLLVFTVLFFVVALQFFTRYVLNSSLGWTEEIARYLLILLAFVGSVTCVRKGKHIYLQFFFRYLPEQVIKPLALLIEATVMGFFAYAGWLGLTLAERTQAQRMVSIDLPKNLIYYAVVAACFAMALCAAARLYQTLKRPAADVVAEKTGHVA
ncbi:MAG: TRAP transporter small permease [Pseudomonadota bacterium]